MPALECGLIADLRHGEIKPQRTKIIVVPRREKDEADQAEKREKRKEEGREVSRKALLVQNTVTHNSLIGTPKDYDYPYHLQGDYHLQPPC